jgi:hypothetical protein
MNRNLRTHHWSQSSNPPRRLRAPFQICTNLAPLSNILGSKHSSIWRRLISVSLDLHSTCTKGKANSGTKYRIEVVECEGTQQGLESKFYDACLPHTIQRRRCNPRLPLNASQDKFELLDNLGLLDLRNHEKHPRHKRCQTVATTRYHTCDPGHCLLPRQIGHMHESVVEGSKDVSHAEYMLSFPHGRPESHILLLLCSHFLLPRHGRRS